MNNDSKASASKRNLIVLLPVALAACVVAPARPMRIAPPPPRVEAPPPPPAPIDYWVSGHWRWDGAHYVWEPGHWVEPRPNHVLVPAHWSEEGGNWVFHPGGWRRIEAPPSVSVVDVSRAPPAPRVETVPPPPGPSYFWVAGHWQWVRGEHVWEPGRWENSRPGHHWVPAHWVAIGPSWRLVPGRWRAD